MPRQNENPTCSFQALEDAPLRTEGRIVQGGQNQVVLKYPNFRVLSPSSGFPDLGSIEISYTASKQLVDQESLEAYMTSFQDVTAFGEDTVNRIFQDLENLLHPTALQVFGEFSSDGDIDLRVVVNSDDNPKRGKIQETFS